MSEQPKGPFPPCPECGSTERRQKMFATLCADCYVVLENEPQVRLSVTLLDPPARGGEHAHG